MHQWYISINNCYNTGSVSYADFGSAGGIVGAGSNICINNCYNTGDVNGTTVGGIVGAAGDSTIINNCYNTGCVGGGTAGGIVGFCHKTLIINNCYNTGNVSGSANAAGILGGIGNGYSETLSININNCYNTGSVSVSYSVCSGGIVGHEWGTLNINNCYNTGDVSASVSASGIVGSGNFKTLTINNCYNRGNISSDLSDRSSGIFGGYNAGTITNCYNTGTTYYAIRGDSGTTTNCYYLNTCSDNNTFGGMPMTEEFMKTQEFVNLLNNSPAPNSAYSLDIDINDGFPIFKWQKDITILSSLTVSEGVLTPVFSSNVYNYTVDVAYNVDSIIISATTTDPDAIVVGIGEKQLAVGINPFILTVTAANGVSTLNYIVMVNRADGVGIVTPQGIASLRVYPNPTRRELRIENGEWRIENVEVFDVFGRKQVSHLTSDISHLINIAHLPTGVYFLKIHTDDGVVTRKVVKN